VLGYGFTENRQFAIKTYWNSVFFGRDPHILDRLYIMVPYMSFYSFSKKIKFLLKILVLAYGTENLQFAAKTDRNSIFIGRDTHILDRLYIIILYMSFYGFSKF
jgi:hypothetical protein